MIPTLRAEFRKLLTVRSTYIVCALALALIGFISFYGTGFKGGPVFSPDTLQSTVFNAVAVTGVFVGILSILVICHEYRYNTIAYSLTISNDRMKVLAAKLIVGAALAVAMTLLTILVTLGFTLWGAIVGGHPIEAQRIDLYGMLWKTIVYVLGSAWLGLTVGFLVRSVVAALTIYFFVPTIEPLIHAVLKINSNYLPIASQSHILQMATDPEAFSPVASAGVFAIYLAVLLIAASVLFVRRDALS